MKLLDVTKEVELHSAHHLEGYDGKCSLVHGHTYRVQVTVRGQIDLKSKMVVDFSELKHIMEEFIVQPFDHHDLNAAGKVLKEQYAGVDSNISILCDMFSKTPTAELMAIIIYDLIKDEIEKLQWEGNTKVRNIEFKSVKIWETATSFVEYTGDHEPMELPLYDAVVKDKMGELREKIKGSGDHCTKCGVKLDEEH